MQALATPLVSIVHEDGAYMFSRQQSVQGRSVYGARQEELDFLIRDRPGTVFETSFCWQLVPAKLYRYEDRHLYLKQKHPLVNPESIGVSAMPELQGMGVFNRNLHVPESLYSGNHIAELFVHTANQLSKRMPNLGLTYFIDQHCWIVLIRQNQVVLVQAEACRNDADAVFHVAAMLEQYGLERDSTPIFTGGMIAEEGQLYRQLRIYFDIRNLDDELAAGPHTAPIELLLAHQKAIREQPIPVS
ncbi:MAG: DUF3822 family protein [Saprospiraceae bacterium]